MVDDQTLTIKILYLLTLKKNIKRYMRCQNGKEKKGQKKEINLSPPCSETKDLKVLF